MIGVILAAGNGSRLRATTGSHNCKALTSINEMHLIEYSLNNLIEMGITDVIIVIGSHGEEIINTIGLKYDFLTVKYVYQVQQKGLINAFVSSLDHVNDRDVVLQLADEIFIGFRSADVEVMLNERAADFYCGYTIEEDVEKIKRNYSIESDEHNNIKSCTEKPSSIFNNKKGTGFCIFRKSTIDILRNIYDEVLNVPNDLCDFINYLTAQNIKGRVFCVADKEFNINTAADLSEAKEFFLRLKDT